ncbi:hypothetical protein ACLOJK_022306 [Asimina triloba]
MSLSLSLIKLRLKFVKERNKRKRQRDEKPAKEAPTGKPSPKRSKLTDEQPAENESSKPEILDTTNTDCGKTIPKEEDSAAAVEEPDMNDDTDEEDPVEYFDGDEEMDDAVSSDEGLQEAGNDAADPQAQHDKEMDDDKPKMAEYMAEGKNGDKTAGLNDTPSKEKNKDLVAETGSKSDGKDQVSEMGKKSDGKDQVDETGKKSDGKDQVAERKKSDAITKDLVVDKDLLQAFRFFDRNRVGYLKVEDLRSILHNLGKFLSHRDVKELVQSALWESNNARDNHILYNKLDWRFRISGNGHETPLLRNQSSFCRLGMEGVV